jgi:hypothetical protein
MLVIKQGTLKTLPKYVLNIQGVYTCCNCSCEFRLTNDDQKLIKTEQTYEDGPYKYLPCPTCNYKVVIIGASGLLHVQVEK